MNDANLNRIILVYFYHFIRYSFKHSSYTTLMVTSINAQQLLAKCNSFQEFLRIWILNVGFNFIVRSSIFPILDFYQY